MSCVLKFVPFLLLAGCSVGAVQTHRPVAQRLPELPQMFDCLRQNRLALVAAPSGRRNPQDPENSLMIGQGVFRSGVKVIQADVARSADGVPVLLRGDMLDKATNGTGPVSRHSYRQLRYLWLRDGEGKILEERIATLDEALVLARRGSAILMLDPGRTMPMAELVSHVRSTGMAGQVILMADSAAEARTVMRLAPEMMVMANPASRAELQSLLRSPGSRLLIFTGIGQPDPAMIAQMDAVRVSAAASAAGTKNSGLDYAQMAASGAAIIFAPQPVEALKALKSQKRDGTICVTGEDK